MHPILFHIPLPKTQVAALYFYLAIAALGLIYAAAQWFVWKSKSNAIAGVVIAALAIGAKLAGLLERFLVDKDAVPPIPEGMIPLAPIPIYSYGVMLGLSLVVGWYLTLTLAEKDGLPKETMANNYVVTAIAAIAGSRILYVLTNLSEFDSIVDIFALRRGGLVAYGGFLGGFIGSILYLRQHKIPLLPWADVAVPSLASGLMITRIGCYLFGCDFGAVLAENDPAWLKKLGTFPRWAPGLLHEGSGQSEGSPAWAQHLKQKLLDVDATASRPVHPTQLYESLVGLSLLVLLLTARRKQKFRGQIFFLFTFAYGVCRYLLEILRDDMERGSLPFTAGKHIMIPLGLAIFAGGFAIGFSNVIKNTVMLRVAQGIAFIPAIVAYLALAPASYADSGSYQWSTSQFVALTTGFAACVAFSVFYKAAIAHPEQAMRIVLPPPEGEEAPIDEDKLADADDEDEDDEPKKPVKKPAAKKPAAETDKPAAAKKKPAVKKPAAKKPAPKPASAEADADDEADKAEASNADAADKSDKKDDEDT